MKVFLYDNEKNNEYIGEHICQKNPVKVGEFLLPSNGTLIEPLVAEEDKLVIFSSGSWTRVEDFRKKEVYSKVDRSVFEIRELGPIPDEYTLLKPETKFDFWVNGEWITDQIEIAEHEDEVELSKGLEVLRAGQKIIAYIGILNRQANITSEEVIAFLQMFANIVTLLNNGALKTAEELIEDAPLNVLPMITVEYKQKILDRIARYREQLGV